MYKRVTYLCQYFSKTEDQFSQTMKQPAKESFDNNMHYHDTMKAIAKACLTNKECSVWEAVYHILPGLWLSKVFLAVYFGNINLTEDKFHVLISEKELTELADPSTNIFKGSNVDRYLERPRTFCNGKYSVSVIFAMQKF